MNFLLASHVIIIFKIKCFHYKVRTCFNMEPHFMFFEENVKEYSKDFFAVHAENLPSF